MIVNERGGEGAYRHDVTAPGPEVVEHAPHQPVGHALAPHRRIGLDVGDHHGVAVEGVGGDPALLQAQRLVRTPARDEVCQQVELR